MDPHIELQVVGGDGEGGGNGNVHTDEYVLSNGYTCCKLFHSSKVILGEETFV